MSRPKTYNVFGHAYFITTTVCDHLDLFIKEPYINIILDNLKFYKEKYKFKLLGYVIMPNHLHLIIFPDPANEKANISNIMRDFKKYTSIKILEQLKKDRNKRLLAIFAEKSKHFHPKENRKYQVWMEGFWSENIFKHEFLIQKLNYIHENPVRKKLVDKPEDYRYSSYRNYYLNDHSVIEVDTKWE